MKRRVLDEEFYLTFSKIYNAFLSFGLIPKDICKIMVKIYEISDTAYYNYLRVCRNRKYVETTYEEMREKTHDRMINQSNEVVVKDIQELVLEATSK